MRLQLLMKKAARESIDIAEKRQQLTSRLSRRFRYIRVLI